MKFLLSTGAVLLLFWAFLMYGQVFFNINEDWSTQNSTINDLDKVDS